MNFLRKLSLIRAAEATVISFVIVSLLGGLALYLTESQRMINGKLPVLQEVQIIPRGEIAEGIRGEPEIQTHVFVKDVSYKGETFIDSWFTAVSALCVTGLTSTDFSQFTLGGQIITLALIQMGGLGIILFTSIFAIAIVRGISENASFKNILAGILDTEKKEAGKMLKYVIAYTLFFEGLGTVIMGIHLSNNLFQESLNGINPWWWSLFHAISAFNNAGFGLLNNNLMNFVNDTTINLVIASLIILGGLGYPVLIAIHAAIRSHIIGKNDLVQDHLHLQVEGVVASPVQTKVAIWVTLFLLFSGTFFTLALEWNNSIMEAYSIPQKIMIAFFQSTSTRTAGFNTIDIGALGAATLFLYMFLMYVGANPGGTGGGIKIPTVAVIYGYIKDWFAKPGEPVRLFKQKISKFALSHAIRLVGFSFIFIALITFLISAKEYQYLVTPDPTYNFLKVLFEIFSAFGTVGLSMGFVGGVTSFAAILSPFSKILLIITMLFGRVGPLTVLAALPWKRRYEKHPPSPDFQDAQRIQIG